MMPEQKDLLTQARASLEAAKFAAPPIMGRRRT